MSHIYTSDEEEEEEEEEVARQPKKKRIIYTSGIPSLQQKKLRKPGILSFVQKVLILVFESYIAERVVPPRHISKTMCTGNEDLTGIISEQTHAGYTYDKILQQLYCYAKNCVHAAKYKDKQTRKDK